MTRVLVYAILVTKRLPEVNGIPLGDQKMEHIVTDAEGQARGLIANVDCSRSSGKCYHLEDGDLVVDTNNNIADYRRYQKTSNANSNNIALNVVQNNGDQEERLALMELRLKDEMKDHVALKQIISWSAVSGTIMLFVLLYGLRTLYDRRCSAKAALRKDADRQLKAVRGLFDKDPEHMYFLVREMLIQHPKIWLKQQHASRAAEGATRDLQLGEADELLREQQRLHYSTLRQSGNQPAILYGNSSM